LIILFPFSREWVRLSDIDAKKSGCTVLVRGRLQVVRETGKMLFVTLRQAIATMQCIAMKSTNAELFKWIASLPRETVVDVTGTVAAVEKRVESATQSDVELQVR
jgi:aspartyl/asparaginyl-tRNA synthetase